MFRFRLWPSGMRNKMAESLQSQFIKKHIIIHLASINPIIIKKPLKTEPNNQILEWLLGVKKIKVKYWKVPKRFIKFQKKIILPKSSRIFQNCKRKLSSKDFCKTWKKTKTTKTQSQCLQWCIFTSKKLRRNDSSQKSCLHFDQIIIIFEMKSLNFTLATLAATASAHSSGYFLQDK